MESTAKIRARLQQEMPAAWVRIFYLPLLCAKTTMAWFPAFAIALSHSIAVLYQRIVIILIPRYNEQVRLPCKRRVKGSAYLDYAMEDLSKKESRETHVKMS